MTAVVTAYCLCRMCCGNSDGTTASGRIPVQGVTVAAPRWVPFGSRVYIQNVGWRVVQDRTARRYDGRWDVYFTRHRDAKRFGLRRLEVTR